MVSSAALVVGALVAWTCYSVASGWRANIAKARAIGLPYIVIPVHPFNRLWQATHFIFVPVIKLLPKRCWERWIFISLPDWAYNSLQDPWERLGDTFVAASPGRLSLWTRDAEVIRQVTARREHFPKPTEAYGILALFGANVVTTEGAVWRMHRKITSASFNEKNAAHTFSEAVRQTQGLLAGWLRDGAASSSRTLTSLEHDTMTLALNIIGYVGFGLRLLWPWQALPADADPRLARYGGGGVLPAGHSMTFADALAATLDYLLVLLVLPWPLVRRLPFRWARVAWEAKENYVGYMREFLQDKIDEVRHGEQEKEGMDIMGQLVRSKYGGGGGQPPPPPTTSKSPTRADHQLSDEEIVGNAFIMIVAGHETTATTLHFALLELATNPAAQRAVQRDVDALFGPSSDPATWNYEQTVNAMLASHLGAAMNEVLRLYPAVVEIPKVVSPAQDQTLVVEGAKRLLPAGLSVSISALGVHRHPRYWPTQPSRVRPADNDQGRGDINDFNPERWFPAAAADPQPQPQPQQKDEAAVEGADTEHYGGFEGPDTSASLFRPARGAFVPFSDGARSCLGRRIAQVEMLAALAVLFQRHSVELAVDAWASDQEVARMGVPERRALYARAQERSRATIRKASTLLTLKLRGEHHVPVRVVRRGQERFVNIVDV